MPQRHANSLTTTVRTTLMEFPTARVVSSTAPREDFTIAADLVCSAIQIPPFFGACKDCDTLVSPFVAGTSVAESQSVLAQH